MSITSMSTRARMAEDLSISQLKQSIQDGVVPSYIGVPLLQEKVKDAKLLEAAKAAQNMGQQQSVTQQIMAQAQQVEQGVPSLPTNLPTASMAGGGIVAFADGGLYDDEESDEDRQDAARQAEMDEMMDEYAQSFQSGIGQLPAAAAAAPSGREGIAGGDAADFVARIMHKESRGRRYGKDGELLTSEKGAQGEMQVMPGTSRDPGFGVKAARDGSPDELARVGRDYAKTLLERYGDPKLAAIAYNMGPGATDKWLAAGADVSKLPKETQGYVKGFSGEDEESLVEEKKRKGVYPYNHPDAGKFTYGDTLDESGRKALAFTAAPLAAAGDVLASPINAFRNLVRNPLDRDERPSMTPFSDARTRYLYGDEKQTETKPESKGLQDIPRGRPTMKADPRLIGAAQPLAREDVQAPVAAAAPAMASVPAVASEAPKANPYSKFEELFARREENLGKQREQDKYMALLQAGLGMMGGTSQHALANIGAGASQGIQSLAQANKDRTAEENALLSGRLGLAKIGSTKEYQDAMMQYRKDLATKTDARARDLAAQSILEKQAGRTERDEAKALQRLSDISKNAEIQAEKAIAANPALNFAQDREAKKQAMIADILRRNAAYAKTYRGVHGAEADPFEGLGGTMPSGGGNHPKQIQSILDKYKP